MVYHMLQDHMAQPLGVSTPQLQVHLSHRRENRTLEAAAVLLERGTLPLTCFTGMAGATEMMTVKHLGQDLVLCRP